MMSFDDLYKLLGICKNNENQNIYKSEILFYLSFLEMNMRNNEEYQINLLNEIENCCYNNNLMLFCAARLSSRLGDNEQTIKILEKRTFNKSQFDFHYLDYLYAMSKFYQQDYVTAQEYFLRYTSNFNGTNYIKLNGFFLGNDRSELYGSQSNDIIEDLSGKTKTNNSGGIQAGISNGNDIFFNVSFKPVSTIMKPQESINNKGEKIILNPQGRHDPCVLPRAVPIVEAMTAIVLLDHFLLNKTNKLK